MKFFITGANGMLASAFRSSDFFQNNVAYSHEELDITNQDTVRKMMLEVKPDVVLNCAAYTNVTHAEKEGYQDAQVVNCEGVKNLVQSAKEVQAFFVHFSTDYVFDGNSKDEFFEDDKRTPVNKYGETKKNGEDVVSRFLEDYLILRVSWLYGDNGHNFVSTIAKFLKERDEVRIVSDQFGKTTFTNDVVDAVIWLLQQQEKGIYHIANDGVVSRYEFTKEMKTVLFEKGDNVKANVTPILGKDYPDETPRPVRSVLSTEKLLEAGYKMRNWKDALRDYLS